MDEDEINAHYEEEKEKAVAKLEAGIALKKQDLSALEKQFREEMKKAKERYDKMMKILHEGELKKVRSSNSRNPFMEKEKGKEEEKQSLFSVLKSLIGR